MLLRAMYVTVDEFSAIPHLCTLQDIQIMHLQLDFYITSNYVKPYRQYSIQ
jgi:hypothetical protein